MASKEAYQQKLKAQLNAWDAQFAVARAQSQKATANARIGMENELEKMKLKREEARKTLDELCARSADTWQDMKESTEKAWKDMGDTMEKMTARFK